MIQKLTNKLNDRKNNKGFTLVELIVVIVILAILAAILIPGLLKWIDEAKDKQYQLEARSVYLAAQAELAKNYSKDPTAPGELDTDEIGKLAGLTVTSVTPTYDGTDKFKLTAFATKFTSSDGNVIEATWSSSTKAWTIDSITKSGS